MYRSLDFKAVVDFRLFKLKYRRAWVGNVLEILVCCRAKVQAPRSHSSRQQLSRKKWALPVSFKVNTFRNFLPQQQQQQQKSKVMIIKFGILCARGFDGEAGVKAGRESP